MDPISLEEVVAERPFREYSIWWPMGDHFIKFMSDSIYSSWESLYGHDHSLDDVASYAKYYISTVYQRTARTDVVSSFVDHRPGVVFMSGEFDAISYAFFRSAYEELERKKQDQGVLVAERRQFTRRVGKIFFSAMAAHLNLDLPSSIENEADLRRLLDAIDRVGVFLRDERYLRDHFAFRLDVDITHKGKRIKQTASGFLESLLRGDLSYALYEMGYAVIMPSAVYLYRTMGEAQHHSSRTMEELFDRVGCVASETPDFDPTGFPSSMIVELWNIRKRM
jgi:hypothetical protein